MDALDIFCSCIAGCLLAIMVFVIVGAVELRDTRAEVQRTNILLERMMGGK